MRMPLSPEQKVLCDLLEKGKPDPRAAALIIRSFCNLAMEAISIWSSRACSRDCGKAAPTRCWPFRASRERLAQIWRIARFF